MNSAKLKLKSLITVYHSVTMEQQNMIIFSLLWLSLVSSPVVVFHYMKPGACTVVSRHKFSRGKLWIMVLRYHRDSISRLIKAPTDCPCITSLAHHATIMMSMKTTFVGHYWLYWRSHTASEDRFRDKISITMYNRKIFLRYVKLMYRSMFGWIYYTTLNKLRNIHMDIFYYSACVKARRNIRVTLYCKC